MRKISQSLFTFIIIVIVSGGQQVSAQDSGILNRLQAVSEGGADFYNIDGVSITYEVIGQKFAKENIFRYYGQYIPNESALEQSDSCINLRNFVYERIDSICEGVETYTNYYFIDEPGRGIIVITYSSPGKNDKELERELNSLLLDRKIPESVFNKIIFNSFNFAGRKIELGTYAAKWTNVNCVQWPYNGEMNWSVHRNSADAALSIEMQCRITAERNSKQLGASVVSDEKVNVIFENVPVIARKVVYALERETADDGKTLEMIIYYVTAPVRNNWVSCVMSHWNNDAIEESGLPALLEKVMKLK